MTVTKTKTKSKTNHNIPRCPDFDEECKHVVDPYFCFLGGADYHGFNIPMAKGYCPLLRGKNE